MTISLDVFREAMAFHPWHFWQLAGAQVPLRSGCDSLVFEHAWQRNNDTNGRAEIRQAIEQAEERIADKLGFWTSPRHVVETHPFPQYFDKRFDNAGFFGADGRWLSLQLDKGKFIAAGAQTDELIGDATVAFSDLDNDNLDETFTISIATTVTDVDEIMVCFLAADRMDDSENLDRWRVEPVRVAISGGTATITGKSWLIVRPSLYEGVTPDNNMDASAAANYVTELSIYRRYMTSGTGDEDDAAAVLIWESRPFPWWTYDYPVTSSDPAATARLLGRVGIRDAALGIVTVGEVVYNATTGAWVSTEHLFEWRPPDRVEIRYKSGVALQNQQVQEPYKTLVARLAAAILTRGICACDAASRELYRWQFDVARTGGSNDESYGAVSSDDLTNPFGTRRGHIDAWKQVKYLRSIGGFSV
jgi:hypothetical protein